jgi:aspartyl-tRNA(Asn)/glutamyl-tRNA(Gln) amidotransferase subunit A
MHQFAYGTTGDRSYFGPARNPHNLSKVTGGSSSGSGAAVAGFMAYGAIGSDTGGSIRIPASCCGIVGMKPTFGRVSKHGSFVLSWTLDHLGPMTRSVMDNALMMNAIAGFDEKDPYSVKSPVEDFTAEIGKGIKGCKVGVPTTFFFDLIQPEVQRIFDINLERMKNQGAEIRYINLEHMDELLIAQQTIIAAEAYAALEKEVREQPEKIEEEVRARIISGLPIKASDFLKVKHAAVEHFLHVLNEVDVIMTPTLCALPPDIDQREIDFNGIKEHPRILARLTGPEDTLGFPAISVPGGFSADGLPVGIQFIGKPFAEKTLYRFAHCIECSD